jgi:FAD dependent oxidoreductase
LVFGVIWPQARTVPIPCTGSVACTLFATHESPMLVEKSMAGNYHHHFTAVGAGIVGVCCAAFLQRQGFSVTLIDQDAPGRGCTFGNAGNFMAP